MKLNVNETVPATKRSVYETFARESVLYSVAEKHRHETRRAATAAQAVALAAETEFIEAERRWTEARRAVELVDRDEAINVKVFKP